ncbi:DNA/RNA non-specific endonuclease [Planococcus salinus]|uniref:Serine protease n=1 Tax=Planococcus salinus TaxID=1848460 RepID=A0A3M8P8Q0_9BACL|nr:DNA/RNA non-specific endonuclease [Planococcus salinus]RNF39574.1 endonuclease [Planococcus salinus]
MVKKRLGSIEQQALQRYLEFEKNKDKGVEVSASEEKLRARTAVIDDRDLLAIARIIDRSDLFPIAHLEAGLNAGKAVCRIAIRNRHGQIEGYGTGFLVAPSLLLTNNHVLESKHAAMQAVAEFNFEDDVNFQPRDIISFRLEPNRLFVTDQALDFTLVAVQETNLNGLALEDFGFLPLLPRPGKVMEGEYVTIIQHPNGGPKAVTIRENEVKFISSDFIQYVSDTEPGSSGAPVFNDQWVVVALHHAGIPHSEDDSKWIANEGIRISSIVRHLKQHSRLMDANARDLLDSLLEEPGAEVASMEAGVLSAEWYQYVSGYDPAFLGKDHEVPLPVLTKTQQQDTARTTEGKTVLDYTHFSIAMSKARKLAFYTAVNIDGSQLVDIRRGNDRWYFDPRIDREYQLGPEFYKHNDIDRGHLVRRQDPNWGMDAAKANEHTFHFTNCSPQHKNFNQKNWLSLEDYILERAENRGLKVSVFTGPVFRADDRLYRGHQIPEQFWKLAVVVKSDGTLSATAYLQTQEELLGTLEFAYGEFETFQVPVARIEKLTQLDFGELRNFDPLDAEKEAAVIHSAEDIRL